jgi:hypothetical protein
MAKHTLNGTRRKVIKHQGSVLVYQQKWKKNFKKIVDVVDAGN